MLLPENLLHLLENNPNYNPEEVDLSWQPNNKYRYSLKETLLKISYDVTKPFVKIYSSITGTSANANLTSLAINLLSYARGYSEYNSEMLWKQAVLETGAFNSIMSADDFNQFGMHLPSFRPTLAVSYRYNFTEGANVSIYDSIFDSVLDRMLWDDYNGIDAKTSSYVTQVTSAGYNQNPTTYPQIWEAAEMQKPPSILVWIVITVLVLILIKKIFFS